MIPPLRLLVTGANGFIGAWALRRLLARGHAVVAFDLDPPGVLVRRLAGRALDAVHWQRGDIVRRDDVLAAAAGCDAIVHLAGVLTPFCREQPVQGALVNLVGSLHVFEAARRTSRRRVVYTSSAGVYGPAHGRFPEPATHYGAFKLATEACARSDWADHRVSSIGLRPFVVYGPGREVGASAGVSLACAAAAAGRPYTIPFTGQAGLVYVEDVIDALVAGLEQAPDGAHLLDLVGEVHDVQALVAEIRRQVPGAAIDAAGEPLALAVDIAPRAPVLAGLRTTPLREGIARTLAFAAARG